MPAKVLIKRRFKGGSLKEVTTILNEFRSGAMGQPGYISGETLVKEDDPHTLLVIGTWQNVRHWKSWKQSTKRMAFEKMLEIYQVGSTEYEEYHLGLPHDD